MNSETLFIVRNVSSHIHEGFLDFTYIDSEFWHYEHNLDVAHFGRFWQKVPDATVVSIFKIWT